MEEIAAKKKSAWHVLKNDDVFNDLEISQEGLTDSEDERGLQKFGPNRLPPPPYRSPLIRFLLQFHNLLIYVLVVAAVVAAVPGHWLDAAVILGVVIINGAIGFLQEGKAKKLLESIRYLCRPFPVAVQD